MTKIGAKIIPDEQILKEIIKLYTVSKMSVNKIGEIYNWHHNTISRILKENKINVNDERYKLEELEFHKEKIINDYSINKLNTYEIAKKYNVAQTTINNFLKINNINRRNRSDCKRIYKYNENYFKIINSEHKAYWLGFIYADGCIYSNKKGSKSFILALSKKDKDHLEKFIKDIESDIPLKRRVTKIKNKEYTYYEIRITNSVFYDCLKNLGVVENKSLILTFPNEKYIPNNLIKHFIRGYLDGDGSICITHNKNQSKLVSSVSFLGTYDILKNILQFLPNKNKQLKISPNHKTLKNSYCLIIQGNYQVEDVLDYLYNDATIYLQRKYEKYLEIKKINRKY